MRCTNTISMGSWIDEKTGQPCFELDGDTVFFNQDTFDAWSKYRDEAAARQDQASYELCDVVVMRLWYDGDFGLGVSGSQPTSG